MQRVKIGRNTSSALKNIFKEYLFIKKRFYLFLERRTEGERGKKPSVRCLFVPPTGGGQKSRQCVLMGVEPVSFGFAGEKPIHWATPGRLLHVLERGKTGRKRRRETTNIDWLPSPRLPDQTTNPDMCSDQESNWRPFAFQDDAQPTEPHWSGLKKKYLSI